MIHWSLVGSSSSGNLSRRFISEKNSNLIIKQQTVFIPLLLNWVLTLWGGEAVVHQNSFKLQQRPCIKRVKWHWCCPCTRAWAMVRPFWAANVIVLVPPPLRKSTVIVLILSPHPSELIWTAASEPYPLWSEQTAHSTANTALHCKLGWH